MSDQRFTLKPYTYRINGDDALGAGIYDAQGNSDKEMLMSEICALLENQHNELERLRMQVTTLQQLYDLSNVNFGRFILEVFGMSQEKTRGQS